MSQIAHHVETKSAERISLMGGSDRRLRSTLPVPGKHHKSLFDRYKSLFDIPDSCSGEGRQSRIEIVTAPS